MSTERIDLAAVMARHLAAVMAEHQRWPGGDWCQECSRAGYTPWPCKPYVEAKARASQFGSTSTAAT